MKHLLLIAALLAAAATPSAGAAPARPDPAAVCAECVKAHMERLAGDAMRGRLCGTEDEHAAAEYIQGELKAVGVAPAFAGGVYRQAVQLSSPHLIRPVAVAVTAAGKTVRWLQGEEMILTGAPHAAEGKLVRVTTADGAPAQLAGAVVFLDAPFDRAAVRKLRAAGAAVVLAQATPGILAQWKQAAAGSGPETTVVGGEPSAGPARGETILVKPEAAAALRQADATVKVDVALGEPDLRTTYNVVGVLHGTAPDADHNALLLSAHYDHLGVRNGVIFHGADDDASGTVAVLEFARLFGQGARPRRTVYFALFGCEESGGLGASYFRVHTPTAIEDLAVNLEFEMIGLRDPKHPNELMLTGWERSNLGPTLAAQGARIGPDPYPEQNFFQRSDNYQLALKGVVAQTVGGWPIPPTYHDASDDLAHIDLPFMDEVIGSMLGPVRWLADSDFKPAWNPGKKP